MRQFTDKIVFAFGFIDSLSSAAPESLTVRRAACQRPINVSRHHLPRICLLPLSSSALSAPDRFDVRMVVLSVHLSFFGHVLIVCIRVWACPHRLRASSMFFNQNYLPCHPPPPHRFLACGVPAYQHQPGLE